MFKFISSLIFLLTLTACGGSHGNNKKHVPPPPITGTVLIDFKPIKGTHIPLVQYLVHDDVRRVRAVYLLGKLADTTSWLTFKNSPWGQNLIGAMFQNNHGDKDLYLWFVIQLTPTTTIEYSLELTQRDLYYYGFESLKIEGKEETRLSVTFRSI